MKSNYEEKALRTARLAEKHEVLRAGVQCLVCRSWKEPCAACKARNGHGGARKALTPKELAERILEGWR
jgi:hypothetical protein